MTFTEQLTLVGLKEASLSTTAGVGPEWLVWEGKCHVIRFAAG